MDFHTLSRRDLQALCKKNKIPANMTNLAMADALQALQTVEGLEDFLVHGEEYLKTPAKSMAATPTVSRIVSKQKSIREEPQSVKPTTTRTGRGARKAEVETSTALPSTYSTRRSTRLLEKQLGQLSLKDDDSQNMQRQFSEDMEKSLVSEEVSEISFSDESSVTKPTEEDEQSSLDSMTVEPVNMTDACDLETARNEVEEHSNMCKNEEDQSMLEEEEVVERLSVPEVCSDKTPKLINSDEKNCLHSGVEDDTNVAMNEDVLDLGSESKANENSRDAEVEISSITPETDKVIVETEDAIRQVILECDEAAGSNDDGNYALAECKESASKLEVSSETNADEEVEENAFEVKAPEYSEDEFGFLSESDEESENDQDVISEEESENDQEEGQTVKSTEMENDNVLVEAENEDMADNLSNIKISETAEDVRSPLKQQSSSKKSGSARRVHFTDNKENPEMSARKQVLVLTTEVATTTTTTTTASVLPTGTPIDKKSLRKLKKLVKEKYEKKKQAEEKRQAPLQVRAENV